MKTRRKNLPAGVKKEYRLERGIKVRVLPKDPAVKTRKQRRTEENKCVRSSK